MRLYWELGVELRLYWELGLELKFELKLRCNAGGGMEEYWAKQ